MTLQEKVNQLIQPWNLGQNYDVITQQYGGNASSPGPGLGAVYGFWIANSNGDNRTRWEAQNDMQAYMLANTRLGIPVDVIQETLHGGMDNGTIFPMPCAMGATWNPALIQQVGRVIGLEARVGGASRAFSPELQVDTDPRFGRTEEAFGEDPKLVSDMGAAYALGVMNGNTGGPSTYLDATSPATEAKHYAAYGYSGKDAYRTDISDQTLFNVYLRPWRAYVRVGGRGVMASHQETNGIPMHANARLLTTVLRGLFNASETFIASDYGDVGNIRNFGLATDCAHAAALAANAGMDQDLGAVCFPALVQAVQSGLVNESVLDRAVSNMLRGKFATGLFDGAAGVNISALPVTLDAPPHRALAYTTAVEGAVLLKNDKNILPLSPTARIALIGPNAGCEDTSATSCDATNAATGGYTNYGARIVTLRDAMTTAGASFTYARGCNIDNANASMIAAAVAAANASDVAVVVLGDSADGYGGGSCAEGIDADSLDLVGGQLPLLQALVTGTATPMVLVAVHGRPFTLGSGPSAFTGENNALADRIAAVVAAWRPGEEGGSALWALLTGAENFSGHLAQSWVRHVGAIRGPANPWFQARNFPGSSYVTEASSSWFPFGFGLQYNNVSIASASLASPGPFAPTDTLTVNAVVNSAGPAGKALVQVYVSQDAPTKYVRWVRALLCYAKVDVAANAKGVAVSIPCAVADTEWYDPDVGNYVVYNGNYTLYVSTDSSDAGVATTLPFTVTGGTAVF